VRAYKFQVNLRWVHNEIGCCMFIPWSRDQLVELIRAITGWETNLWELMRAGERCVTMARAFNMREGWTRADDVLPARMAEPHVSKTINEKPIMPEVLDAAITAFYSMMGWDPETGQPSEAKLHELDIAWVREAVQ
jgi:aldehyde:ferredoxin oxidoreductase